MQYKITNKLNKQGQKGPYVSATLTDEQGIEYIGINAFNGEFNVADTWHGDLVKNGNYYNLVSPKMASQSNFRTQQTERLMEKKETAIRGAQDHKEYAIRVASTMSGAVSLAIAEFGTIKDETTTAFGQVTPLETLVDKWRKYLWQHWDDPEKYPPTFM